jgi:CHAT domain-containing protein
MTIKDLARQLIDAPRPKHPELLSERSGLVGPRLAEAIRRECVEAWARDPKRVQACVVAAASVEKVSPKALVAANADWVRGIASITKGKFEKAVQFLRSAGDQLSSNGREADAADSKVALLLALAMLGRYDEAIDAGMSAIPVLVESGDELAAGKIEMNLSNIVSRRGDHQQAYRYCASARERFIRSKEKTWQAMAENGLANTAAEQNNFDQAEQFYRMALNTAEGAEMRVTVAEIQASMGNLALLRGRYNDAVRYLEISRQKFEDLGMPHQSAIAELEIADIYAEINLNPEALEIYERVTAVLRKLRLSAEEARARLNYSRALVASQQNGLAKKQLERASQLFAREKNPSGSSAATLAGANLAFADADYAAVLRLTDTAVDLAHSAGNERLILAVEILAAETYLEKKETGKARNVLAGVVEDAKRLQQSDSERLALNLLGRVAVMEGDFAAAQDYFQQAIRIVEHLRAPLAFEEFSMSFLAARLEPYRNLTRLFITSDRPVDAFETLEKARSRTLVDALERSSQTGPDSREPKLRQLREELNSYYKRIDRADDEDVEALRKLAAQTEKALSKLTREIASVRTKGKSKSADLSYKKLAAQLGAGKTLLEFVEFDGLFGAFVATGKRIDFVPSLAQAEEVSASLDELHFQFESLRYGSALPARFAEQIRERTDNVLSRLYASLIRPLEDLLAGKSLIIVPAGPLHYVPFAALFDGKRYLVEKFELASAPSATVWSKLGERKRRKINNSLLVGYADEKIPLVEEEISQLRRIVPEPKTLAGEKATLEAFIKNAGSRDLVHLACHGEFRTDNPMFSSLHLADGWITVSDLLDARLHAQLVTLSACETGVNKIHAGDELLGLARGFFSAGAASLIVTLWRVNDEAAMRLMGDFYKGMQRAGTAASSLQDAQKMAIRRGESPYMWSPFVYQGR